MNLNASIDALLQIIAALLIFVSSYLGLVVCAILCFVIVETVSERAGVGRAYGARKIDLKNGFSFSAHDNLGGSRKQFHQEISRRRT